MSNLRYVQSRTLWLAIFTAFFVIVAYIIGNNVKDSTTLAATSYTTGSAQRGDLEAVAATSGKLLPMNQIDLSFQVSGVISNVSVKPGDNVKQGLLLAKLDSREIQLELSATGAALKQAQAKLELSKAGAGKDLAAAQATLKQAETRLLVLKSGGKAPPEDVQAAQAAIDQAQAKYNNLLNKPNPKDVEAASANLRQALAKLEQIQSSGNSNQAQQQQAEAELEAAKQNLSKVTTSTNNAIELARINQEQAQRTFDNAKTNFDKIFGQNHNADGSTKPETKPIDLDLENNAKNTLADAQTGLDKTKLALSDALSQADSGQKEAQAKVAQAQASLDKFKTGSQNQQQNQQLGAVSAQAEVDQARANLEKAAQGATKDELDGALAEITNARAKLDKVTKGSVNDQEVAFAQADVDKAQAVVDSLARGPSATELNAASSAVEEADALNKKAQLKLEQTSLTAPFNGVIGAVRVVPGQNVGSGVAVVTLMDMSALKINAVIPESDVTKVTAGMAVRLGFDSLPSLKNLRGRIADVSLQSSLSPSGIGGYQITVLVDKISNSGVDPQSSGLKPGMNANLQLVVDRKTGVIVIPRRSVKILDDGKAVEVLTATGQLITVPVALGIVGEKEVEVKEPSLLLPGDQLVIGSGLSLADLKGIVTNPDAFTPSKS